MRMISLWAIILLVGCFLLAGSSKAEEGLPEGIPEEVQSIEGLNTLKSQSQPLLEFERRYDGALEALKSKHPELIEKLATERQQRRTISNIVRAFRREEITEDEAKKQLYPIVKGQIDMVKEMGGLDQQIALAEKYLEWLKQLKRSPSEAVRRRIEHLLQGRQVDVESFVERGPYENEN